MAMEVVSRVGVTRREFGWDRVLVDTIWHCEGTSNETSLLMALVLGFSDSVATRVFCILILMPENAPEAAFPATVILYRVVSLLFCGSKIKTLALLLFRRMGERTEEKEKRVREEEKQKTNDSDRDRERGQLFCCCCICCLSRKVAAGFGAAMRGIIFVCVF